MRTTLANSLMLLTLALAAVPVHAEDGATLPGGASALRETHGDWAVGCTLQTKDKQTAKICSLTQEQADSNSHQRVLAVELVPGKDNGKDSAKVTLVLPFGLDLDKGVTLRIDDGEAGPVQKFKTCLPAGCLIELTFNTTILTALNHGKALALDAVADGGQKTPFSISLNGFQGAYDRTVELSK